MKNNLENTESGAMPPSDPCDGCMYYDNGEKHCEPPNDIGAYVKAAAETFDAAIERALNAYMKSKEEEENV